jgi:hypothetical protein
MKIRVRKAYSHFPGKNFMVYRHSYSSFSAGFNFPYSLV